MMTNDVMIKVIMCVATSACFWQYQGQNIWAAIFMLVFMFTMKLV